MPGSLADDNKAIFQRKYVEELDKGVDPTTAGQLAAAETPYVKARAKFEYKYVDVKVIATSIVMMGIPPRKVRVPSTIHVTARKSK